MSSRNLATKEVDQMSDHGLRLRSGVYEQVKNYLGESSDRALAKRLMISESTVVNAKRASSNQEFPAPMLFVAAASQATKFPLDAFVYTTTTAAKAA